MSSPVVPLPSSGDVFVDAGNPEKALRVSWHHDAALVVLSLWRADTCIGTLRLAPTRCRACSPPSRKASPTPTSRSPRCDCAEVGPRSHPATSPGVQSVRSRSTSAPSTDAATSSAFGWSTPATQRSASCGVFPKVTASGAAGRRVSAPPCARTRRRPGAAGPSATGAVQEEVAPLGHHDVHGCRHGDRAGQRLLELPLERRSVDHVVGAVPQPAEQRGVPPAVEGLRRALLLQQPLPDERRVGEVEAVQRDHHRPVADSRTTAAASVDLPAPGSPAMPRRLRPPVFRQPAGRQRGRQLRQLGAAGRDAHRPQSASQASNASKP